MTILENTKITKGRKYFLAICYCGKEFWLRADARNKTKSCGCLQKQKVAEANKRFLKHGFSNNHRLYGIWKNIKSRCSNKNKYYGGRGITICDEWRNDFKAFYDWAMANGYQDSLTIDRINNDGNYQPSNCRWVTQTIQVRNVQTIRKNNKTGFKGVSILRGKYQSSIVVNKKDIYLGVFKSPEEAGKAYDDYVIKHNLEHTTNKGASL